MSILEKLWADAHPSWINWFKMPHWLYWLSWRPRRCCICGKWYWACWYDEYCSRSCADEDIEAVTKCIEGMERE